jgi:hypothetical protein
VISKVTCCPDKGCAGHGEKKVAAAEEMAIAPSRWSVAWDLFAWMGHRRFARHWSVPQIRAELKDRFEIEVSADLIEDYTARYEVMVAARESDLVRLVAEYEAALLELLACGLPELSRVPFCSHWSTSGAQRRSCGRRGQHGT